MNDKLDTKGWSKEKIDAYEQNLSKLKLQKELEKIIKKNERNNSQE